MNGCASGPKIFVKSKFCHKQGRGISNFCLKQGQGMRAGPHLPAQGYIEYLPPRDGFLRKCFCGDCKLAFTQYCNGTLCIYRLLPHKFLLHSLN